MLGQSPFRRYIRMSARSCFARLADSRIKTDWLTLYFPVLNHERVRARSQEREGEQKEYCSIIYDGFYSLSRFLLPFVPLRDVGKERKEESAGGSALSSSKVAIESARGTILFCPRYVPQPVQFVRIYTRIYSSKRLRFSGGPRSFLESAIVSIALRH